ncbi:molecular chaperone, partial [Salmonella enterica subsp. enterica serovar Cerro]|nr:molecular chaperone [Salmonella enterica subsp. enterica serovar Cerro]
MKKLLFFSLFFISTANAGVVIYGTRIIYPAEKNEVLVQL